MNQLKAYDIVETYDLTDIQSKGMLLRHKKTGARVSVISNEDENKVFCIGFRTPPEDETGVAHIIEHTVLCGSDKYPVKDPFVELAKGSLNTFLNAITYPDKTVYPVASCNDQDFKNLMSVYMDAVLHPNIYKYQEIFKQEGWHYELEDKDGELTINGVVYNEMKGAYSSPDAMLQQNIEETLFPDTTYGKNSGGNPKQIPKLTYEYYLDFHRRYYHPSNSYICLYGNMDVEERLNWLDEEYLCHYDKLSVDSEIHKQKPFTARKEKVFDYPIAAGDSEKNNAYFSYTAVVGDVLDKNLYQAFDILAYALVNAPGAPVKQALLDAGIGMDASAWYDSSILQPMFTIMVQNADMQDKDRFEEIVLNALKDAAEHGLNRKSLLAAINSAEFSFREADFGRYPKGLMYLLNCFDSWLYDDEKPFWHLECLDTFRFLREQIDTGYFEKLVRDYLVQNPHSAVVAANPKKGLNSQEDEALKNTLAECKAALSGEEMEALIAETKSLKEYQQEPSSKEDMEKLPLLTREDIRKEILPLQNEVRSMAEVKTLYHNIPTNGIHYLSLLFEADDIKAEDIPYLGVLKMVLGYVNTENYSYSDLANEVNIYTGGISSDLALFDKKDCPGESKVYYRMRVKVLSENLGKALELLWEIMLTSNFEDPKRMGELLAQAKANLQISLSSSGNRTAACRALSYQSQTEYYRDAVGGIGFYQKVKELAEHFSSDPKPLFFKLKELANTLFVKARLLISYTGDEALYQDMAVKLEGCLNRLPAGSACTESVKIQCVSKNEGFLDASQIQYVARSGNFRKHGFAHTSLLQVLSNIMDMGYLWNQIRVVGGAYGCFSAFYRSGNAFFTSYRDPNLGRTNEVYEKAVEFIRNFEADERDMTKYIIGTFSSLDIPLNPGAKGDRSLTMYLEGITEEELQKERDTIRNATQEDIRGLADLAASFLSDGDICVIGNEDSIQNEKALFNRIENLV